MPEFPVFPLLHVLPSLCLGLLSMSSWPLGTCYQSFSSVPLPSNFIGYFPSALSHFERKKIKICFLTSHILQLVFKISILHFIANFFKGKLTSNLYSLNSIHSSIYWNIVSTKIAHAETTKANGYVFIFVSYLTSPCL